MINFSKKKTLIFLILIFFLIIAGGSYWYYQNRAPQPERFTNIRELFTILFTPTMEKWVNHRLQGIDCISKEYWYTNNQVCFSCNKAEACFGYTRVIKETPDQKRMNPIGIVTLKGDYTPETKLAFYSYGISKLLNCKYDQIYQCENGIEAVIIDGEAKFIFPEDININQKIKEMAKKLGMAECKQAAEAGIDYFQCGIFGATIHQNIVTFRIL